MSKAPYQSSNRLNAICFLAATGFMLWVMRSGALAMWDRHSPGKEGPILPWVLAVPAAIISGAVLMPLLTWQITAMVDWRRQKRGD